MIPRIWQHLVRQHLVKCLRNLVCERETSTSLRSDHPRGPHRMHAAAFGLLNRCIRAYVSYVPDDALYYVAYSTRVYMNRTTDSRLQATFRRHARSRERTCDASINYISSIKVSTGYKGVRKKHLHIVADEQVLVHGGIHSRMNPQSDDTVNRQSFSCVAPQHA